jgi:hypothetical protein
MSWTVSARAIPSRSTNVAVNSEGAGLVLSDSHNL